jgi:hypothetical protein
MIEVQIGRGDEAHARAITRELKLNPDANCVTDQSVILVSLSAHDYHRQGATALHRRGANH